MANSWMPTTRWSIVVAASGPDVAARQQALGELAKAYRRPVFEFIARRLRGNTRDTEDLTQEVFVTLMRNSGVATADPAIGRFRAWLLGVVKHCIANHRRYAGREKRDSRREESISSIDYLVASAGDAELAYHRAWIQCQYRRAQRRIEQECAQRGETEFLVELQREHPAVFYGEEAERGSYAALAERLGVTPNNLKVKVHRLRERFAQLVRDEVAQTLGPNEDIDVEIADLLRTLQQ